MAVNHLVGGSSLSRGARKYEGLAISANPSFFFGVHIGVYGPVFQIFPTASFKSSIEIVV